MTFRDLIPIGLIVIGGSIICAGTLLAFFWSLSSVTQNPEYKPHSGIVYSVKVAENLADEEGWREQAIWAVPCGYAIYLGAVNQENTTGGITTYVSHHRFAVTYEEAKEIVRHQYRMDVLSGWKPEKREPKIIPRLELTGGQSGLTKEQAEDAGVR